MEAAVYVRISLDADGKGLGVERQEQDCRTLAQSLGWNVADVYIDNDTSASSVKPRPEYERLLADLAAGTVNAVVVYAIDRLTRKPAELETFIDLADKQGIALANVSGDVELSSANGRMVARIMGAVARQEAERIGERVRRQKQQRAEQGLPQGGRHRLYGYNRDWTLNEDEAAVIREAFARRATGESTTSIANDFASRGLTTVAGNPWKSGTLGTTLTKPGYAGISTFKGEVVGKTAYPAIVDEATFEAVQSNLVKDSKGTNARKHLLSGFLVCSKCLTPMKGNSNDGYYKCNKGYGGCGGTGIKIKWTDRPVLAGVFNRQATAHLERVSYDALNDTGPDYKAQIADVDARIEQIQAAYRADDMELTDVMALLKVERDKRKALVKADAARVVHSHDVPGEFDTFDGLDISRQRVLIETYLDHVVVLPSRGRGYQKIDVERLELHYKPIRVDETLPDAFQNAMKQRLDAWPVENVERMTDPYSGGVLTNGFVVPVHYDWTALRDY